MQGTVDRVWHNHDADGSEYWVLCIGGQRYSTWDKALVEGIGQGDAVEFSFTRSGRFRHLSVLKRQDEAPGAAGVSGPVQPCSLELRLRCLRIAADLARDANTLPDRKVELAITLAQQLERHLLSPPKPEQPVEAKA